MHNLLTKLKKRTGFSLTELVVTTAIMGTLAAVAVPRFSAVTDTAKQRTEESNINAILSAASNYYSDQASKGLEGLFPGQTVSTENVVAGAIFPTSGVTGDNAAWVNDWEGLFSGDVPSPYGGTLADGYQWSVAGGSPPTIKVWDKNVDDESSATRTLTP